MKLPTGLLKSRSVLVSLGAWPRIIKAAHATTPARTGFGSSRFSSPSYAFRILYAAEDFRTAFSEAVIRDRLEGKQRRFLYRPHLEALMVTDISSTGDLKILDLTNGGTYELGINTDVGGARSHEAGQKFSEELHAKTDFDGILFNSRLTTTTNVAIYERAFPRIAGSTPVQMTRLQQLYDETKRLDITIRRKYGSGP